MKRTVGKGNIHQLTLESATRLAQSPAGAENSAGRLLKRWAARDRLVLKNLPLVRATAIRIHDSLPDKVNLDDLMHAGVAGLFDACTHYRPGKKFSFFAYTRQKVRASILDSLKMASRAEVECIDATRRARATRN